MRKSLFIAVAATILSSTAFATDMIRVGVVLSETGPGASLGIPEKNAIALLPHQISNHKVEYIVLNDGSDVTTAVRNTRKLITEEKVDVIIGSTMTPSSMAMIDVAAESETPMITMSAGAALIEPMDAKRAWIFKTPQNDSLMATALVENMVSHGIKTVGFIGFADAYGEGWHREFARALENSQITIVANERFARPDTSVTGQVLKIVAVHPDAVLIAGSGTPAALPQKTLKERGYKGQIYQTHGVANNDFLRVCGKDCEGTILPAGPLLVADQLSDSNASKQTGLGFREIYERAYGPGVSTFAGHGWDAGLFLEAAIPSALRGGNQPGSKEFRKALRESLEHIAIPITQGIVKMSPTDHSGLDVRARVIVKIKNGRWVLINSPVPAKVALIK